MINCFLSVRLPVLYLVEFADELVLSGGPKQTFSLLQGCCRIQGCPGLSQQEQAWRWEPLGRKKYSPHPLLGPFLGVL